MQEDQKRKERGYDVIKADWRGIGLTIRYHPTWSEAGGVAHLEIIADDRQILPITETGYKSHFLYPDEMKDFESPVALVIDWLEHEGGTERWKRREAEAKQMSLF